MTYKLLITQDEFNLIFNVARERLLLQYVLQEEDCQECAKLHPSNTDKEDVLAKVLILNSYYSTRVVVNNVVENILRVASNEDFEKRLANGDPTIVTKIAHAGNDNFSFATKYCALLQPKKFPIYDSLVWKFFCKLNSLGFFDKATKKKFANVNKYGSNAYQDYLYIYKEFMDKSGISKFERDYRKVDHFIWGAIKIYLLLNKNPQCRPISPALKWLETFLPNLFTSLLASAIWHVISQIKF